MLEDDRSVREFIEKPTAEQAIATNLISAGAYVLERSILDLVEPDRNVSIEREVWPRLVGNGLYGFPSEAYWLDIGTPDRYLQGTFDIIEGNLLTPVRERLGDGWLAVDDGAQVRGRVIPPALLEREAVVEQGAHVGSLVVLGQGVRVGAGATIERSVVLAGSTVGARCELRDCIVAPGCSIGEGSHVSGGAMLGENVRVGAENVITRGARIFPGVELPDRAIRF
jgi:mannose-1-phosphate guanylyltransferase